MIIGGRELFQPPLLLKTLFCLVNNAMRHMRGGNMLGGGLAMAFLVVKENIRAEGFQESALGYTAQK
jgi:hypothetical protein